MKRLCKVLCAVTVALLCLSVVTVGMAGETADAAVISEKPLSESALPEENAGQAPGEAFAEETAENEEQPVSSAEEEGSEAPAAAVAEESVEGEAPTDGADIPPLVAVSGVTLDRHEIDMFVGRGNGEQLVATVLPEDADNKNVTWASSNENNVFVDDTGLVWSRVPAPRPAPNPDPTKGNFHYTSTEGGPDWAETVTVTTEESGYTDVCNVNIYGPRVATVAGLPADRRSVKVGDRFTLFIEGSDVAKAFAWDWDETVFRGEPHGDANNSITFTAIRPTEKITDTTQWPAALITYAGYQTDFIVTAANNAYSVTSTDLTFTGGNAPAKMVIDADHTKYTATTVDGTAAPVEVASGSTVITFPAQYLNTLSNGTHTVRVEFTDGYAQATLTIKKPGQPVSPQTDDRANLIGWVVLAALAGLTLVCTVLLKNFKKHPQSK
ncbi:MAG TPA: hypothetical protein DEB31_10590 [Clostridiales bacterium]|nr:hypothetical protein [Clostridiales bacterium]